MSYWLARDGKAGHASESTCSPGSVGVPVDGCTDRAPFGLAPRSGRPTLDDVDNSSEVREFLTTRRARITPEQAGFRPAAPDASPACGVARSQRSPGSASSTTPASSAARSPAPPQASSTRSPAPCSSTRPNEPTCSTSRVPPTASPPRAVRVVVRRARPRRGRACSGRSRRSPMASRSCAIRARTCSPPTPWAARSTRPHRRRRPHSQPRPLPVPRPRLPRLLPRLGPVRRDVRRHHARRGRPRPPRPRPPGTGRRALDAAARPSAGCGPTTTSAPTAPAPSASTTPSSAS